MTIDEMIKKYNICIPSEDETKLMVRNVTRLKRDNAIELLKEKKQEIIARLKEIAEQERKAREEYRAKVQAIEGLEEIRKAEADWAEADWEEYHARFMEAFGHEDAAVRQARMVKPTADPVELKKNTRALWRICWQKATHFRKITRRPLQDARQKKKS